MASTPESKVKAQVKALLDEYGAYHFPPNMGGYGRSGIPDIIACCKGRFVAVECKAGGNKPTALQLRELDRIKAAGGIALVLNEDNMEVLRSVLSSL
jgi:Holliday junction resolvase